MRKIGDSITLNIYGVRSLKANHKVNAELGARYPIVDVSHSRTDFPYIVDVNGRGGCIAEHEIVK